VASAGSTGDFATKAFARIRIINASAAKAKNLRIFKHEHKLLAKGTIQTLLIVFSHEVTLPHAASVGRLPSALEAYLAINKKETKAFCVGSDAVVTLRYRLRAVRERKQHLNLT